MRSRKNVLSLRIDTGSYSSFVERIITLARERRSSYVCVANAHMVVESHRDTSFGAVVNAADLVTPDGMPVAKAMQLLHGVRQPRVAGMDLVPDLISAAAQEGVSIFLYGSTEEVLERTVRRMRRDHPALRIAGVHSPPFRPLSVEESLEDARRINDSGAHLLLLALGCPKQERWMAQHRGSIDAVMVGIGGALPVYAGLQRRAPRLLQRLSLEWLYRLCQEPRRLFRRYLVTNTLFLILLTRQFIVSLRRGADAMGADADRQLDAPLPPS